MTSEPRRSAAKSPARRVGEPCRRDRDVAWRIVDPASLSKRAVADWLTLERRALEPNAFLSPSFVLPMLRTLSADRPADIVFVENASSGALLGVGVFAACGPTRLFPLRHCVDYKSAHSFTSGLLIDAEAADAAIDGFFDFFSDHKCGVVFQELPTGGPLMRLIRDAASRRRATVVTLGAYERAVLRPAAAGQPYVDDVLGKRIKKLHRARRRLDELGRVEWRVVRPTPEAMDVVERHLELEHRGWKGEAGSSMRARGVDEQFFREMCAAFAADGRLLFTELLVDGTVVSVTSTLTSGSSAFSFKVGYDPEFAKYSPGQINELEFIRRAPEFGAGWRSVDSGAQAGSFIERLWTDRIEIGAIAIGFGRSAKLAFAGSAALREVKRYSTGLLQRLSPSA